PFFFCLLYSAPPAIYTLSLHDALPICRFGGEDAGYRFRKKNEEKPDDGEKQHVVETGYPGCALGALRLAGSQALPDHRGDSVSQDRKSTRLNSSHLGISYAVFCLKKKK